MPTLHEIQQSILGKRGAAQDEVRRQYLRRIARHTKRDTILYATAFTNVKNPDIPALSLSVTLEDMQGFMASLHGMKGNALDLILHSPGGSMEAADQIVQYLRSKYSHIRAIVPQNAMSAATMIACACDSIVLSKHSALGPIDPQVTFPTPAGLFTAPAQAVLDEFETAKNEIAANPASAPIWLTKIQAYPPGFLTVCRTTLDLAKDKVAGWLDQYMFKNTAPPKPGRAIADWLGNANDHKTHGRPISADLASSKGLVIERLEDDQTLQDLVLSVFHASIVTFLVTPCVKIIEGHHGRGLYTQVSIQTVRVPAQIPWTLQPNPRLQQAGAQRPGLRPVLSAETLG